MDRARVWLAVSPLMATGVLVSHALAYRVTGSGTSTETLHAYLDHAPQVLAVLTFAGLALAALASRVGLPAAWPFPVVALVTFVAQEHLERVAHTGEIPWLLASPVFLVGVLFQLPVAVVTWALARRLLRALGTAWPGRPHRARLLLPVLTLSSLAVAAVRAPAAQGRGPPPLQPS